MPATIQTKPEKTAVSVSPGASKPSKKWAKHAALTALALFAATNVALLSVPERKKHVTDSAMELWSGPGSINLTVNGFKALPQRPTIVLMGSSLVMHPFWAMDAERSKNLKQFPDIFHYHLSKTFEQKLASDGAPNQRVYNFAIFGQMISDAYIYVDEYLKGDKKPDVVMLGIAPRDFYDAELPSPTATFTFKRLIGLENFHRYADAYLPQWQDKADWVAQHICYFYGKRWRLQKEVQKVVEQTYDAVGVLEEKVPQTPLKNGGFMLFGSTQDRWTHSSAEYHRRYHGIAEKDLSLQENFLKAILKVCNERKIKVVLVNMPLSQQNRNLMPPGYYEHYKETMAKFASDAGVKFDDLDYRQNMLRTTFGTRPT